MTKLETSERLVHVPLGERSYDILIGPGLMARAGGEISTRIKGRRAAIVTDENVGAIYLDQLMDSLQTDGIEAVSLDELTHFPLVIPTRPNSIRMLVESELAAHGQRPQISLEIDGVAAILDLVADGAGCAVLPMNAVTTSGKPEVFTTRPLQRVSSSDDEGSTRLRSKLFLAVSSQRPATLTQQAMAELIRTTLQALY